MTDAYYPQRLESECPGCKFVIPVYFFSNLNE